MIRDGGREASLWVFISFLFLKSLLIFASSSEKKKKNSFPHCMEFEEEVDAD